MACREEAGEARKAPGPREEEPGEEGKDESARRHRKDIKGRSLSCRFYVSLSCLVFSQNSVSLNSCPDLRISAQP